MGERGSMAEFVRRILVLIALVALVALVWKMTYLLLLLFGSVVLAVVIRLIARQFERIGLSQGIATSIAVLCIFGALAGLLWIFGGLISSQFALLYQELPSAATQVQRQLNRWGLDFDLRAVAQAASQQASTIFQRAGGFVLTAGSVLTDMLLVLVGAIFLAANPDFYRKGVLRLLPRSAEPVAARTLDDSGNGLKLWLAGQAVASVFVGVLSYVGLTLIGVPSAAALAIIASVLELIPYVGPILAAVPAIILGFSVDPTTGLWTLALYVLIQQLEGYVITPLVQKRAVELPPLVLLFSIFAAGALFGPLGVILAAPLTVVVYIMIQHLYIGQVLGREPKVPGQPDG